MHIDHVTKRDILAFYGCPPIIPCYSRETYDTAIELLESEIARYHQLMESANGEMTIVFRKLIGRIITFLDELRLERDQL